MLPELPSIKFCIIRMSFLSKIGYIHLIALTLVRPLDSECSFSFLLPLIKLALLLTSLMFLITRVPVAEQGAVRMVERYKL